MAIYKTMYKYDVHVHTSEVSPCAKVNALEVVKLYKKAGYAGIVITDHYFKGFFESINSYNWKDKMDQYLEGYRKAFNEGRRIGLNVILGMEITFTDSPNDFLVYGINEEFLKENPELYNLNLREFRGLIEGKGMLIYQAHPFRTGITVQDPGLLDGIEVYNGNPRHDSRNPIAYLFAYENGLKMVSGSDFHQIQDLAKGGIILKDNIVTLEDFVEVLRNGEGVELIMNDNYLHFANISK